MKAKLISSSTFNRFWEWLRQLSAAKRWGLLLVVYSAGVLSLERIAQIFETSWRVSPWDPASALHITLLLSLGNRYLPIVFLARWLSGLILNIESPWLSLSAAIYVSLGHGSASYLLKRWLKIDPRLYCWRDVAWFTLIAGLIIPLVAGTLYVMTLFATDQVIQAELSERVLHEWAGESTGIMMLAPILLSILRILPWGQSHIDLSQPPPPVEIDRPSLRQGMELILSISALAFVSWLAYGIERTNLLNYDYLSFLPLILIASRRGLISGALAVLFINVVSVILVGGKVQEEEDASLALQFGLMATSLTGVLLGAITTDRRQTEEQLHYQATHDSLTRLYNRNWFLSRLSQVIGRSRDGNAPLFAVLFLDLDRFKIVNDSLGHRVGDWLLTEVARQLQRTLRPYSQIARIGGDEFIILLEDLDSDKTASSIAEQICQELAKFYEVGEYKVFTTISLGLTLSSHGYATPEEILRDADIALYQAKARGKNQYAVFDRAMYDAVIRRSQLEQDLRQAIEKLDL